MSTSPVVGGGGAEPEGGVVGRLAGLARRSARRVLQGGPLWWPARRRRTLVVGLVALATAVAAVPLVRAGHLIESIEQTCASRQVSCSILSGAATSALTAVLVSVVWIGGVSQFVSLRRYRTRIDRDPARAFHGSWQGEPSRLTGRHDLVRDIARELGSGSVGEPVMIVGAAGSGKTSVAVLLAQELARRGLVPALVPMRHETVPFDPETAAVRVLRTELEHQWVSPSVIDQVCVRVRRARMLVAVLDGLDEVDPTAPTIERQLALAAALQPDRLRIPVVATVRPRAAQLLPGQRFDLPPLSRTAAASLVTRYEPEVADRIVRSGHLDEVPFFLPWLERADLPVPEADDHPVTVRRAILDDALADLDADHCRTLGLLAVGLCALGEYQAPIDEVTAVLGARSVPVDPLTCRSALLAAAQAGVVTGGSGGPGTRIEFTHTQLLVWAASRLLTDAVGAADLLSGARLTETAEAFVWAASRGVNWSLTTLHAALSPDNVALAVVGIASLKRRDLTEDECRLAATAGDGDVGLALALVDGLDNLCDEPRATSVLLRLSRHESYEVRWRACRALANGGSPTLDAIHEALDEHLDSIEVPLAAGEAIHDLQRTQEGPLWFMPGLAAGCSGSSRTDAMDCLGRLQRIVEQLSAADAPGCLGAESSLAQGYKLAACLRPGVLASSPVEWLATASRFWYARVEALHALAYEAIHRRQGVPPTLSTSAARDPHPLVRQVAGLAVHAVESGSAAEWLWEDEMSVARAPVTNLRPEAVQTVADVVLLLNLSENGDQATRDRNARRSVLPSCLAADDHRLRLTEGPGCGDGCPFGLCPYHLDESYVWARGRFSETFCRTVRHAEDAVGLPDWYRGRRRRYLHVWRTLERPSRR